MSDRKFMVLCSDSSEENPRIWTNVGWVNPGILSQEKTPRVLALSSDEASRIRGYTQKYYPYGSVLVRIVEIVSGQEDL